MLDALGASAPADPLSARIVLTVAMLGNTLESFDDLDITLSAAANKHADGVLGIMGPAAVFTAILQAAPVLAGSDRVAGYVDLFVDSAVRRRSELLAALPAEERDAVAAHELTRSVPPQRVIDLFSQAISGSALPALVDRITSGKDIEALEQRIAARSADLGEQSGPSLQDAEAAMEDMPLDGLRSLGEAIAGTGLDELALARVLDGVLPPETPDGFVHDGAGTLRRAEQKVGRNDPCPCGSGKKYKKCHARKGV